MSGASMSDDVARLLRAVERDPAARLELWSGLLISAARDCMAEAARLREEAARPPQSQPAPPAALPPAPRVSEGDPAWLSVKEVSAKLKVPLKTVYSWRRTNQGPPAYRFGKHWRFDVAEVNDWIVQQRAGGGSE